MDLFTYDPAGVESLDAFNGRLAAYAATNDVTGVVSTTLGDTLLLSLTVADDIPAPILLRPFVVTVAEGSGKRLETDLSVILDKIKAEHTDDNMSVPVEVRALNAPIPGVQAGYVLFLVAVAELDDEPEGG